MKSSKKSSKRQWSVWGDWVWSRTQNRYYRQRQDNYGNIETNWGPVHERQQVTKAKKHVPRQANSDDDEELAAQFQQKVYLSDNEHSDSHGSDSPRYSHQPTGKYSSNTSRAEKKRRDRKDRDRDDDDDKGKGKSQDYGGYEEEDVEGVPTTRADEDPWYPGGDEEDPGLEQAINTSRRNYGQGGPAADETPYDQESESAQTQTSRQGALDHLSGDFQLDQLDEDLDPRYKIESSHKFQPGEVFKVLWPEPSGRSTSAKPPTISDKREIPDRYGGSIFVGFRRFIVVANDFGHCTCVPILTYGGKACKKKGVKPEKHGIITHYGSKARAIDGEPKLGFPPIRVVMHVEGERLARESRVNYSKLVTVEHNVKVFFIGYIHPDDYELVADAVNKCWELKTFHKRNPNPKR